MYSKVKQANSLLMMFETKKLNPSDDINIKPNKLGKKMCKFEFQLEILV